MAEEDIAVLSDRPTTLFILTWAILEGEGLEYLAGCLGVEEFRSRGMKIMRKVRMLAETPYLTRDRLPNSNAPLPPPKCSVPLISGRLGQHRRKSGSS